jgi:anthranilate phosphoribosyltransferase
MSGLCTDAQIAAFLVALRLKGETVDEITGCAKVMREKASRINPKVYPLVDTCGTGGDQSNTFNISTCAAFVVAGCDIAVAKHGNKSVSSQCGSADVLEALGINIQLQPVEVQKCIEDVKFGFMFAPLFHSAMKYAIGPRKELGIRTIFNILGPLTNPANAKSQVLGVFSPELTQPLAEVLDKLGSQHVFVVHGSGLDEITVCGETRVSELKNHEIKTYNIQPEDFGMKRSQLEELQGGSVEENARIIEQILKGNDQSEMGAKRDVVLLNAAAAIVAADKTKNFQTAITLAEKSINSGSALAVLEKLKEFTNNIHKKG